MVNVGVMGFAHGHIMAFGREWAEHPEYGVRLTGGWDSDEKRRKSACEAFGIKEYDDPDSLLDSGISAVVITCETLYHADLVQKAANAKKDIILYKPMALTMAQADKIVEAVESNGVRFTMGWQMRVDPQNIKIKELIRSGELGRIALSRRRHALSTHEWSGFEDTWHDDPRLNRDIFADDSAHPIDMMNWIFGMPESVTCEMSTVINPRVPNDTGVALFRYPNGMIAEISCQFTTTAAEITTEVYGDRGSVQQYWGDAPSTNRLPHGRAGLKYYRAGDSDWTVSDIPTPAQHGERLAAQAKPFAEFLRGEREAICSCREGRDDLRLVLACYLSARTGRRVSVWDERVYDI